MADRLSPAHRLNRKQEEAKRGRKGSPPSPRAPEPSAGAPRCAVKAALELQRGRARDEAAGPNVAQSTTTTFRTTRASFAFARSDPIRPLAALSQNGLTAIHDPGIGLDEVPLLKDAIDNGSFPIRSYAMYLGNGAIAPSPPSR